MKHRRNLSSQSLRTCQFRTRLNYGASMICSQSYGFSHSHVQMWELDHKEGRTLKNWCFRTVVLEKTLQSPLGSKEIKPVHPKGSQSKGRSGASDSLRPHGLQHDKFPCPSSTPGASSNSCPSSRWCHPTISSSVIPFSSCLQSFPASGSFPVSQFFTSVAKVLEFQLQLQFSQWIFRTDSL